MAIINAFPTTLVNGTIEDATQVMTLFNWLQSQTNTNACPATTGTVVLKGNGAGGTALAVDGTDYFLPSTLAASTGASKIGSDDGSSGALWTTVQGAFNYLKSALGSVVIGFIQPDANAVATDLQTLGRQVVRVTDWGVKVGASYAAANCTAYAKMVTDLRTRGLTNLEIVWPSGEVQFSPKDVVAYSGGAAYQWRADIELVDATNVYHHFPNTTIYLRADPTWYRGNSTPVAGLDENVIQFRASAAGLTNYVGFSGNAVFKTDQTLADPTAGHADGSSFGVAYRGCQHTTSAPARYEWWGTDGLYFGSGYGGTFGGYDHVVYEPKTYRCYRQGISVVNNSTGVIVGGSLELTQGGSFGHGIDFEPDGSNTQQGWTLIGTRTKDNQRGACNFINTSDVTWINPQIDEQAATSNAAIYLDGSNVAGYDVKHIQFIGGYVQSLQPLVYATGNANPVGGLDDVLFKGVRLSCLGATPASNSWLRINPNGLTGMRIGRFTFDDCVIDGNGGISWKSDGTNEARLTIKGGKWQVKNYAGTALAFGISTASALDVIDLDGIEMSIASTMTMATSSPYIIKGSLKNCRLSGQAGAIITWVDYGAGRTNFVIGYNEFSTYNYYKGVVTALNLQQAGTVEQSAAGDSVGGQISVRIVHGGRSRIINYLSTPAAFTNRQAPLDGDICRNGGNSSAAIAETEFVYDGNAARWRLSKFVTKKGTTANRPTPTALAAVTEGLCYQDTTLAANGKPIWWNGAAWVDATGSAV